MTNYENLPGAARLNGSPTNEPAGDQPIQFDPDKHRLSIAHGKRPQLVFTNSQLEDQTYSISPKDVVSTAVTALLARTSHTQQHAEITLHSGTSRAVRITLDPTNIDTLMEQLLESDVAYAAQTTTTPTDKPLFGELTNNVLRNSYSLTTGTPESTRPHRRGLLSFFTTSNEEEAETWKHDHNKAQQIIGDMADETDLPGLQNATLRMYWAMLGDRYLHAFDKGVDRNDQRGNRWHTMFIGEGDDQRIIRINFDGSERPVLVGKAVANHDNVANLFIDVCGDIVINGYEGTIERSNTEVVTYKRYSVDEIQKDLPVIITQAHPIITRTETTQYTDPNFRGWRWQGSTDNKKDVALLIDPLEDDDHSRRVTDVSFPNFKYLAGTQWNGRREREHRVPARVVLGECQGGRVIATNIDSLQVDERVIAEQRITHAGCTLVND